MATYYVDPAASGADDGSSWTDAWETFQQALNGAGSGDVVYCRGTEDLSSPCGTNSSGSMTTGSIHFVGCDAGGTPRAGWFTLNAYLTTDSLWIAHNFLTFENILFATGSNSGAKLTANSNNIVFRQCRFEGTGSVAFYTNSYALSDSMFIQCYFNDNNGYGVYAYMSNVHFRYCRFVGNTSPGIYVISASAGVDLVACLVHNNNHIGVYLAGPAGLHNCVVDGNADDGIYINNTSGILITGCRITNNGDDGIEATLADCDSIIEDWNGFYGNAGDDRVNVDAGANSVAMAGDGYTDRDNDDFNLTGAAEARDLAIPLDVLV